MRVPTRKNVNWDLKRRIFKLKERIRRWWERYVRRQKIRGYIIDNKRDVVKAISLKGEYSITIDSFGYYNGDYVYAYKLIAMKYGLDMSISNTRTACLYLITLKKRQ
jgi:hypothetical protein